MKHSIYLFTGMAFAPIAEFPNRESADASLTWLIEQNVIEIPSAFFYVGPSPQEFGRNGHLRPIGCLLPSFA